MNSHEKRHAKLNPPKEAELFVVFVVRLAAEVGDASATDIHGWIPWLLAHNASPSASG